MAAVHTFTHLRLTQDDFLAEAKLRFGDDPFQFAFQCPTCEDVATLAEFRDNGADPGRAGQECIGRHLGALDKAKYPDVTAYTKAGNRGCDWAAYGLFRGPWEILLPADGDKPERSMWAFPLAGEPAADGPVARALAAKAGA